MPSVIRAEELIMIANKVIPENLVVVPWLWEICLFLKYRIWPQQPNFQNDFDCNNYHVFKLSVQTIEGNIFTLYDFI